ncbi:uncharacterized protein LOC131167917 isoform X1 [Malania oleifera]|uniref:uncharacterized protein LOC131167917 isoform X1 n=1 Tax=Malania oleifera TaxID=397392 RepID=UPI0025ADB8FF|nr:uncharacterized protein LOC131167917 isoform X1 [Malania oleifera]
MQQILRQSIPTVPQIRHQINTPDSFHQQICPFVPTPDQVFRVTPSPVLPRQVSIGARLCAVYVASAQCCSGGKDDFVPELYLEELQSSFTGHMKQCLKEINWTRQL